ncbi:MAG: Ppx/GppA phosphatase family protein [Saccharospirillum sp.]
MSAPPVYAAIDLGANSFHLVIMKDMGRELQSIDCRRELVRLAAGVDEHSGRLNRETRARALRCLTHFNAALKRVPDATVIAVGTSAFRKLVGDKGFLKSAETTLGHPIRILSGDDEARYIYRGAANGQDPTKNRFVLDIGGGSTEIIVGQGRQPNVVASLDIGCVTLTSLFLNHDRLTDAHLQACQQRVDDELSRVRERFSGHQWQDVMGSSGSIKAVSWALTNLGISTDGRIERTQLDRLYPVLTQAESQRQLSQLLELSPRRIAVFAAGYIILHRVFHCFDLTSMRLSYKAIREGLIDEMVHSNREVKPVFEAENGDD